MNPSPLLDSRLAAAVNRIGGRLCLDFVNTVGARHISKSGQIAKRDEKLNDFLDLVAWARAAGALTNAEAERVTKESMRRPKHKGDVFRRAVRLREVLYRVCLAKLSRKQPSEADLAVLNEELRMARAAEQLVPGKSRFDLRWSEQADSLDRVLWPIARSTAEFLTKDDLSRLRQCGGIDCGWIFLDTSRNHKRRWCDMRDCGNLAKVRRFRQRAVTDR
jgi:predicted RNA-binding Zn ribbon-like protein